MANQQLQPNSSFAPLRVQRSFQTFDDGRGARAAALAEALGVALDAAPRIAEHGSREAFRAGMEARIDGVKRENAGASNKSLLGFMFSSRAQDGFDYQDAQLEIPLLQSEELIQLEATLHDSRNPEDFRNYIAQRDQIMRERLQGRSDIYRYTVAEAMQKTREDSAKLFTSWVQRNRERDRRAAAGAAARAQAEARAAELRAAGNEAFEAAQGGDPDWFGNFVTEATEKYGITPHEAKSLALHEATTIADLQNSPQILDDIDPRFLDPKQREALAEGRDKMFRQQDAYATAEAEAAAATEAAEEAARTQAANDQVFSMLTDIAEGQTTPQAAVRDLISSGTYRDDPDGFKKAQALLNSTASTMESGAMDAVSLQSFKDDAIRAAVQGDNVALQEAAIDTLSNTNLSPAARAQVMQITQNAEKWARDQLFEGLEDYYSDIERAFPSLSGKTIDQVDVITGNGGSFFEVQAATRVRSYFEDALIGLSSDWYSENPNMQRMPYRVRTQLADEAYGIATAKGQRQFAIDVPGGSAPERDPEDALGKLRGLVDK